MTYVLDTNILSELMKGNPKIVRQFEAVPELDEVATTTVSRYEVLKGRYSSLLTAANKAQLILAQQRLQAGEQWLSEIEVLPVDDDSANLFEVLRQNKKLKKIGRPDLLIACIVLAHGATLVTRNVKDFILVPRLTLENWAD